jgi:hypothetical protein
MDNEYLLSVTQVVSHRSIDALRAILQSPIEFPHQVNDEYFPSPHCCLDSMVMVDEYLLGFTQVVSHRSFDDQTSSEFPHHVIDKYFPSITLLFRQCGNGR